MFVCKYYGKKEKELEKLLKGSCSKSLAKNMNQIKIIL